MKSIIFYLIFFGFPTLGIIFSLFLQRKHWFWYYGDYWQFTARKKEADFLNSLNIFIEVLMLVVNLYIYFMKNEWVVRKQIFSLIPMTLIGGLGAIVTMIFINIFLWKRRKEKDINHK